jgi:hypothetical protein
MMWIIDAGRSTFTRKVRVNDVIGYFGVPGGYIFMSKSAGYVFYANFLHFDVYLRSQSHRVQFQLTTGYIPLKTDHIIG